MAINRQIVTAFFCHEGQTCNPRPHLQTAKRRGDVKMRVAARHPHGFVHILKHVARRCDCMSPGWCCVAVLVPAVVYKERSISEKLVRRAERAGYQALVVTVDTPLLGKRLHDARTKFQLPPPWHIPHMDTILTSTTTSVGYDSPPLTKIIAASADASLSWESIAWLRSVTNMKIVLKGIMTAEDTEMAVRYGVDAVVVSNHGGRQLDGVLATIDALPEVVRAARGRLEVYLDGGIRRGTDVFKALALGAKAVLIGRPVLWGLAYGGEAGLNQVIGILNDEFRLAMALAGCSSISEITPEHLAHISEYTTVRPKL
ncbi:FMN-dependent dehydrogenase-domain-containing protein [Jimgerdemannia flammicorona]|uniref:FMN-dependent dehydrogenase-domain-containing protein n=1 Tax=Jimgerdemannia flammicorona TaxID=994334 RepID=A0A433D992_9FUNG|nr:FMN-dependent dehydrogenase-domain-containing protein [Jimgerdemannia flammicorona]